MSLLTGVYCVVAILNLWTIISQLQPVQYADTHNAIRIGLGFPAQYGWENSLSTNKIFYDWLINTVTTSFFTDNDENDSPLSNEDKTYFQNYVHVWQGILLFQWKRNLPDSCPPGFECYGSPAYESSDDPFISALQIISNSLGTYTNGSSTVITSPQIDYRWIYQGLNKTQEEMQNKITRLRESYWVNKNTSRVYVVLLLYNPSTFTRTCVVNYVEWTLGGLSRTECDIFSFSPFDSTYTPIFILQLFSFLSILALLILEGGRAYRAYRYSKKPYKYRSQILKAIGVAFSTAITLTIVVQWTILSTAQYTSIPYDDPNEQAGLKEYLKTLNEFHSTYTFLTYYRLLITLNVIMFIGRLLSLLSYYDAFAAINAAVDVAFWPLATVLTYLAIVLLASAVIGTINFGPDSSSFSFWTSSFMSLFRFICMADFDYSDIAATQVNKPLFLLFYCGFILYGYFVIINIFSAIIFDSFDSTKMYRISLRGHGSQFRRTFTIITRCMWPGKVLLKLNPTKKDEIYTWKELSKLINDNILEENEVKDFLEIYGEIPQAPPQEQEHEE